MSWKQQTFISYFLIEDIFKGLVRLGFSIQRFCQFVLLCLLSCSFPCYFISPAVILPWWKNQRSSNINKSASQTSRHYCLCCVTAYSLCGRAVWWIVDIFSRCTSVSKTRWVVRYIKVSYHLDIAPFACFILYQSY